MKALARVCPLPVAPLIFGAAVALSVFASTAQEPSERGIIVGHVELGPDFEGADFREAILLSPEWALAWNMEVQQRIDTLFANNIGAVNRDRDLFSLISSRARRESTTSVIARMQARLGADFGEVVREIMSDGNFEFVDVPFGEYRVIVIAGVGDQGAIWSGTVTIRGTIPEFVEIQDRIQ